MLLSFFVPVWLLRDAWREPQGQLHFNQGQWLWRQTSQESTASDLPGTLRLHLDLQSYMLVSFSAHTNKKQFFPIRTPWFHLEGRQTHPAAGAQWLALRRAVLASPTVQGVDPIDEAASKVMAHEKRLA